MSRQHRGVDCREMDETGPNTNIKRLDFCRFAEGIVRGHRIHSSGDLPRFSNLNHGHHSHEGTVSVVEPPPDGEEVHVKTANGQQASHLGRRLGPRGGVRRGGGRGEPQGAVRDLLAYRFIATRDVMSRSTILVIARRRPKATCAKEAMR